MKGAVQSSEYPNAAPACEYVPTAEQSSSAAPVIMPKPKERSTAAPRRPAAGDSLFKELWLLTPSEMPTIRVRLLHYLEGALIVWSAPNITPVPEYRHRPKDRLNCQLSMERHWTIFVEPRSPMRWSCPYGKMCKGWVCLTGPFLLAR